VRLLAELELEEAEIIYPSSENPRLKGLTSEEPSIQGLASSIRKDGQLQRIIVRKLGDKYQTIDGDRRCVAIFKVLKWKTVKATAYDMDDREALRLRLVANIQKEDLSPIEKGHHCIQLFRVIAEEENLDPDKSWSSRTMKSKILAAVSEEVGVSPATVINWIRMWNDYPPEAQKLVASNREELRKGLVSPSLAISAAHVARKLNVPAAIVLQSAIENHWTSEHLDHIRRLMREKEKISFEQVPAIIEDFKKRRVSRIIFFVEPFYSQSLQRCNKIKMRFEDYINLTLEFTLASASFQDFLRNRINREIIKMERE